MKLPSVVVAVAVAVAVTALLSAEATTALDWSGVTKVLQDAVADGAFPGAVAIVGDKSGVLYQQAVGRYTYGKTPPFVPSGDADSVPSMKMDTRFDMASCTKVLATTSAVALLYQNGHLALEDRVADRLDKRFAANGKADITVLNCLLHNAGYPPDPVPGYWYPSFGCPETNKTEPAENWSCRKQTFEALMQQTLQNPIGAKYVYSDLSFITLMWLAGKVAMENAAFYGITPDDLLPECVAAGPELPYQCYFEALVRKNVMEANGLKSTGFLPKPEVWGECAPCENDTTYLRRVVQGQVSDQNAYALGGISGHAGLFSTAPDVFKLLHTIMFRDVEFLNVSTWKTFVTEYNHTQSSRALGWNTNDPTVFDQGWNMSCGPMSPRTYMHLGYTGTMVCSDPDAGVISVMLTNRVYPTDQNIKIRRVRQLFSAAVVKALSPSHYRRGVNRGDPALESRMRRELRTYQEQGQQDGNGDDSSVSNNAKGDSRVFPFKYPLFKQCNSTWGNHIMEGSYTVCAVGCLMSSISMALRGHGVTPVSEPTVGMNPGTFNDWLRAHHGYVGGADLNEAAVPPLRPSAIKWVGSRTPQQLNRAGAIELIKQPHNIVIANVMHGHHFVLVTGWDPRYDDILLVNDPGFTRYYYNVSDIVGWRLFTMV